MEEAPIYISITISVTFCLSIDYEALSLTLVVGGGAGGLGDPYLSLNISSSWVKIRLHTENGLPMLSGSALKVKVVVVVGGPTNNLVYPNYS